MFLLLWHTVHTHYCAKIMAGVKICCKVKMLLKILTNKLNSLQRITLCLQTSILLLTEVSKDMDRKFQTSWKTEHTSFVERWLLSLHVIPDRLNGVKIKALWGPNHHFQYLLFLIILAVCLGSWSCCSTNFGQIGRFPVDIAWWRNIYLYFSALRTQFIITKSTTPFAKM